MPEEFKNAIITGHFGFGFEENSVKSGRFKLLLFEERFRKAPFSGRIRMDGRPNCRNRAAFSIFSGVVWTLPNCLTL